MSGQVPTSVDVTVRVGGRSFTRRFPWSGWNDGLARRITVPVDAVNLTLTPDGRTAVALADTVDYSAMSNGTLLGHTTIYGTISIVDRRNSPFGAGWWLDGLEQFVGVTNRADQKLWVGGDGSTRVYTRQGASSYWLVTPAISHPDTLESVNATTWRRHLSNGAYVEFDNSGTHTRTRDALGRVTQFTWTSAYGYMVLQQAALPVITGSNPVYTLSYAADNNGFPRLSTVTAPASNVVRTTTVAATTGIVNSIVDPDGRTTNFAWAGLVATKRINKLGDTTSFAYDEAGLFSQASIDMRRTGGASAVPITHTFCASESRSLTSCDGGGVNSPPLTAKVYTFADGARTDVGDTTTFVVNQYGAPEKITPALQLPTVIEHTSAFPLLVSRTVAADGFENRAFYNWRGLLDSTSATTPYGLNVNAVTRYTWDPVYSKPVQVTLPTGLVTTFSYDPATGNQLWQRPGNNAARQVTFSYGSSGILSSVSAPLVIPESLYYDGMGNLRASRSGLGFFNLSYRDAIGRDTLDISPIDAAIAGDTIQLRTYGTRARTMYSISDLPDSVIRSGPARPYSLAYPVAWSAPVSPDTLYTRNGYDAEGRLISVTANAGPDTLTDIRVSDTYGFDAAGRLVTHGRNGKTDRTAYDLAGNDTSFKPASGGVMISRYDAANRLTSRVVPQRSYTQQHCEGFIPGQYTSTIPFYCLVVFPAYPNDASNGYTIPADTSTFTYDALGHVLTANNGDARVTRTYYLGGALKSDSIRYR